MRQIETPYSYPYHFPYGYPNGYSLGRTKKLVHEKSLLQKCINSFLARKIAGYGFFLALTGLYPTLRFDGAFGLGVGAF